MSFRIILLWIGLSLSSLSFSQETYTVKGMIADSNDNTPILGAYISIDDLTKLSSEGGLFSFGNISKGEHVLTVSYMGYVAKSFTIQVNADLDHLVLLIDESNTELEEVELYGKTQEDRVHQSPITSVQVSEVYMNANRENSLMQTLSKIPGVSTINIGSGQSKPVIRGLGFNRVSVVQNGVKHEAQQWGNDHGLEIDQYGIEEVNIIKGAASLLYGSDAIAGVVDIQPAKKPLMNSFGGDLNVLGETNNDLIGISAGIQGRKEKWFYRSRLTYRDYGDFKVPTTEIRYENYVFDLYKNYLRNTAGNEANAALSVGFVGDKFETETFVSNVHAKNGFFANAHGLEVRSSDIDYDASNRDVDLPYHEVNHFKVINNTTLYRGNHTWHFELGFQNNYRQERSEPVPHGYMPAPDDSLERLFNKNTYSFNARDVFNPNEKHDLVFGLNTEYQDNNIGGWGFLIPAYDRFTAGIFAFDHIDFSDKVHFQVGLRYDYGIMKTQEYVDWFPSLVRNENGTVTEEYLQRSQNTTLNFNNFSGSIGLSFTEGKSTYKFNIGKSFRMPLANELASDGVNYHMYRFERGDIDLDPEESYQLDVDIDYVASRFRFGLSPFVNWFENFIYLNPTSDYYETLQIYEYTQSQVFRAGGEMSIGYNPISKLRFDGSLEYVFQRQMSGPKKGFTIPFSPPLSGLLSANYNIDRKFLFFDGMQFFADYRVTAKQDRIVPPEEKTDGYQILNLSFMGGFHLFKAEQQTELRFKVNNVFDTKYFNHTSFYRLIDVPEPGRNISLSLTIPL